MRFKVFSHIRSGTEWFAGLLDRNFGLKTVKGGHRQIEKQWDDINQNNIYIVRDGRDVLAASYYYWLNGGSPRYNIGKTIREKNITFGQFLRGKTPTDEIDSGCVHFNHVIDPICNWVDHVRWVYFTYAVRYEDLKNDLHNTMVEISREFDLPLIYEEAKTINKLIGVKPRKGVIGDYKNLFTEKDLKYFWHKAGNRMLELGYVEGDINGV